MTVEELKTLKIGDRVRLRGDQDGIVFNNEVFTVLYIIKEHGITVELAEYNHIIKQFNPHKSTKSCTWNVIARYINPKNTYTQKELLKEIYHDLEKIL